MVLDASALLALLNQEPGGDVVAGAFSSAVISAVNLAEVAAKLTDLGLAEPEVRQALGGLGLPVHDFDAEQALTAGLLRGRTRALGLSLGDRSCLALGVHLGLPVLTADRSWQSVDLGAEGIEVRPIR